MTNMVADLDRDGVTLLVAKGGEGGQGNRAFKTSYRLGATWSSQGASGQVC